jgi:hypothetical protein
MITIDKYSIKARLYPALIVLLPILFLAIYYIVNFKVYFHYLTAFVSVGLFSFLLSQLARDKGKKIEPNLYNFWGGKPTIQILRHSDKTIDIHTKKRIHNFLNENLVGIIIPTKEQEMENLKHADEIYESCSNHLISKTRDNIVYELLFKENINYGFRRNLYGMRIWGISILIISTFTHLLLSTDFFKSISFKPGKEIILYSLFSISALFWFVVVNRNWVKLMGFEYAKRLYETINK